MIASRISSRLKGMLMEVLPHSRRTGPHALSGRSGPDLSWQGPGMTSNTAEALWKLWERGETLTFVQSTSLPSNHAMIRFDMVNIPIWVERGVKGVEHD
jgi:hypothetical protein